MFSNLEKILFFLTILFLPTQLGRHFWPQFSFIYSLPVDYLSPTLYFWDILVGLLWIVFLISKKHINRIALSFLYFFILTQALSLMSVGANIGIGLIRLEQYLIAGFFGVYIASQNLKEAKPIIFWGLTLAIIGESLLALGQFIKGATLGFWIFGERSFTLSTPAIAKFDFYGREFLRPYGTFPHPNVLAGFLVITTLLLSFWGAKRLQNHESVDSGQGGTVSRQSRMTLLVTATFLAAVATILTASRTAMIAGFVAGLLLLTKRWKIVLVFLVLILSPFLYTRYSSVFNFDSLTLLRREELSLTALNLWATHYLFGVGLNNFIPTAADALLTGPSRFLQPVHNIFLLSLSETGIVGLIGLISLIGYPLYKDKFLIVWASLIFLGLFDHYFLTLPQGIRMLFLVWGISLCMLEWKSAQSN